MTVTVHHGDCRAVLAALAALVAESADSVVTDPPYHLTGIVKRFGSATAAPASKGFMGKVWDGGDAPLFAEPAA